MMCLTLLVLKRIFMNLINNLLGVFAKLFFIFIFNLKKYNKYDVIYWLLRLHF